MQHICNEACSNIPRLREQTLPQKICAIPAQAQKGFTNIPINFTCLDVCEDYLAIGSNIGIVYLYDWKNDNLHKLKNNDYANPVTCVKILVSLECMVIFGCKKGTVIVFKIPLNENDQVEKFTVAGLHEASVTALEWVKNGIKFFSGDSNGVIVSTEIDHFEHQSRSKVLLEENGEIVQLDYQNKVLLVSTVHRSFVYHLSENKVIQVGQKDRKCSGKFGATFFDVGCTILYASRPGQRLWKSDASGSVSETVILKNALSNAHHSNSMCRNSLSSNTLKDFQFSLLRVYNMKYLLTWSGDALVLINPELHTVTSIQDFNCIVGIACRDDQIFILQGIRHLIRLGVHPHEEPYTLEAEPVSLFQEFLVPLKELSSKSTSKFAIIDSTEAPKVFDWLKRKFSDTSINTLDDSKATESDNLQEATTSMLPDVIQLDPDLPPISTNDKVPSSDTVRKFSSVTVSDEIVYKRGKKKGKKKKKVQFFLENENKSVEPIMLDPVDDVPDSNTDSQAHLESSKNDNSNDTRNLDACSVDSHDSSDASVIPLNKIETEFPPDAVSPKDDSTPTLSFEAKNDSSQPEDSLNEPQLETPTLDIYSSINFSNNNIHPATDDNENKSLANDNECHQFICDNTNIISSINNNSMILSDSFDDEVPKYGVDWVQYNAPGPVISLSVSGSHIFCVDNRNVLYVSEFPVLGFVWKKLQQPAEQVAVSQSEQIIWVLYKGTVFAAERHPSGYWKDMNWVPIAREIIYMAVDDTYGWYIASDGSLIMQQPLSATKPYTYPQNISCPANVVRVSCKGEIVWLLTKDDKLYCKMESPLYSVTKPKWKEIKFEGIPSISNIFLCPNHVAIIVDVNGTLWFRIGITPVTPEGLNHVWQVESIGSLQETRTSSMNNMVKSLTKDMLSSLLYGQQESCIAVSESGVWHCQQTTDTLYCNQKYIIGHSWDVVIPTGTVLSMKWKMLSSKGISNSEGLVWGSNSPGEVFCFSEILKNPTAIELPDKGSLKCLESYFDSLWVLTSKSNIYIRREMSERCPQGVWWQQLNTSQLSDVTLSHISCSSESVWACDTAGTVYVRLGSLTPSPNCLMQAWVTVDSDVSYMKPNVKKFSAVSKQFPLPLVQPVQNKAIITKVCVGPKEYMVWAIDDRNNVFMRDGITSSMLLGEKWVFVPSPPAKVICISNKTTWLLKPTGEIYRRFGITRKNPAGDYWKEIPGNLSYLSVTFDDELWGIRNETICQHASYTLDYFKGFCTQTRTENVMEADWEDVMMNLSDGD